jgi:hypothetical protein
MLLFVKLRIKTAVRLEKKLFLPDLMRKEKLKWFSTIELNWKYIKLLNNFDIFESLNVSDNLFFHFLYFC